MRGAEDGHAVCSWPCTVTCEKGEPAPVERTRLTTLLSGLRGTRTVPAAMRRLRTFPGEPLGCASIDHYREIRQGFPEVILCDGQVPAQTMAIAHRLLKHSRRLLATRVAPDVARALRRLGPRAACHKPARAVLVQDHAPVRRGDIVFVTAGTADIPVAEEARITAEATGSRVEVCMTWEWRGCTACWSSLPAWTGRSQA